jgi:hypothetical protein
MFLVPRQTRLEGPSQGGLDGRGSPAAAGAALDVAPRALHGRVQTAPRLERWDGAFPGLIGGELYRALETPADHEARAAIQTSWWMRMSAERKAQEVENLRKERSDAFSRAFTYSRQGVNSARLSTAAPCQYDYRLEHALREAATASAAANAADLVAAQARNTAQMELNTAMMGRTVVDARLQMLEA